MSLRRRLERLVERSEGRGPCTQCWEREERWRHEASDTEEIRRILSIRDSETNFAAEEKTISSPDEFCAGCGKRIKLPLWFIDAILAEKEAWRAEQRNLGGRGCLVERPM